jgi:hypothetical protein
MKYLKFVILLVFSINAYSQNTFNLIIEDTINHVTCGIVEIDTGYILVTGSRNEHLIRTFATRYINSEGNCIWKKTYTDSVFELWEGYNNIKKNNQFSYIAGTRINTNTEEQSIYLQVFDSVYNQSNVFLFYHGFNWKQALNQIYSDSSYYIVGQDYLASEDKFRLLLLKSNYLGDSIWCNTYGNISEGGVDLFINYNNEIVVGGITGSFSSPVNNSKWYIIKTDTAGNLIWEKAFGHNTMSNGSVRGLIETPDSCILACGTYPAAGYGAGGDEILPDGCLRKIDMNGDLVWEKRYRNYSKIENPDMIHLEASLNSILYVDSILFALGNNRDHRGASRGYLQKLSNNGDICWQRNYYAVDTNSSYQWLVSFKPTSDNGFILAGYGNNYNSHGYDPPQQAWLVKTDSLGMDGLCNVEPDELNFYIEIPEIPESICSDDTIQVYVHISGKSAPYTLEFSTGQVIDSIYYPPTFVPIEIGLTDINLQWNNQTYFEETITEATLSNHEWGQCIVKPVEFYTPATLGTHEIQVTVTDAYGESTSITKNVNVVQCSTFNEIEQISGISIYPNPAKDFINIEITDLTYSHVEIFDIIGQLVLTAEIKPNSNSIDIRNLFHGSYVLKLSGKNGRTETLFFEKE